MKSVRKILLAVLVFTILTSSVTAWGLWCYCNPPGDDGDCQSDECGSGTPCCGCGTASSSCTCCSEPDDTCVSTSGGKSGSAECHESIWCG